MHVPSREVRYGAYGVLSGLTAVIAGRCGGGSCLSCFACAVPGAAVVLAAALGARPGAARSLAGPPPRGEQEPVRAPQPCTTCRRQPTCRIAEYTDREVAICSLWEQMASAR